MVISAPAIIAGGSEVVKLNCGARERMVTTEFAEAAM
jgi:hypothetical protein